MIKDLILKNRSCRRYDEGFRISNDMSDDGNIRYWRDENGIHHVPKRLTEELIFGNIL